MNTIGRYMVIIITLAGMTLSVDDRFSKNDILNFFNGIFELHNKYRQEHRVESLRRTFDNSLVLSLTCIQLLTFSKRCYSENATITLSRSSLTHSGKSVCKLDLVAARILDDTFIGQYNEVHDVYGQIIHEKKYDRYTKLDIDEAKCIFIEWYMEGTIYNYFSEPSNNETYRFTQIVWKDTVTFGIALKWTHDKYVVQMVYFPRGNIPGQFKNNVLQRPIIAYSNSSLLNHMIYRNVALNFKNYIVYLHNEARIKHGVPKLQRDKELDKFAYNILRLTSQNMYQYDGMYGKNYLERPYDNNTLLDEAEANAVFLEWYNKGGNYDYFVESSNNEAAEFTQIVWRSTETMGISMSRENGVYRVLAFYNPPGNIKRKFISNVFRPQSME